MKNNWMPTCFKKINENRLLFVFLGWVLFGQVFMAYILILTPDWHVFYLPWLKLIPNVFSLYSLPIFDRDVAVLYHATMVFLSFLLSIVICLVDVVPGDLFLIKSIKDPLPLSFVYVALAAFNLGTGFYNGFYTFGLSHFPCGFAFLSSVTSFFLPYSVAVMKVSIYFWSKK